MPSRSKRVRKAKSIDIQRIEQDRLVLKKRTFEDLRNNTHFITAVRVGRILNALLFVQSLVLHKYDFKKSADRRRWTKVFQLNIGYIHEAFEAFGSVESKYAAREFYQPARALISPVNSVDKRRRKLMRIVRDSSVFHLDKDGKMTATALGDMLAEDYYLISSDDGTIANFHFDLADEVDLVHIVETFRAAPDEDKRDIMLRIGRMLGELGAEVISAADKFLDGLLRSLELRIAEGGRRSAKAKKRHPKK
jgi:hypothetical protein